MAKARGRPTGGRETRLVTSSFATQGSIRASGRRSGRRASQMARRTSRKHGPFRSTVRVVTDDTSSEYSRQLRRGVRTMAGARRRNLALVLSLAVQVAVAPWLPCPCSLGRGGAQAAADHQREAPEKGGSRCELCETGREAQHCQSSPPMSRHTAGRDSALPGGCGGRRDSRIA